MKFTRSALVAAALAAVIFTSSCARSAFTVNLSAAASLTDALKEINKLYERENPGSTVVTNFGGSGTLRVQIENGAPVDVFISAAEDQVDALQKKQLIIDGTRRDLLSNKVVLIVPAASSPVIAGFRDLAGPNVAKVAIGDPKSVPAGMYAQQIFDQLGIAGSLKSKLVLAGDVRQALTYVESGNVDAAVVFLTDARTSNKVKIVATAPDEVNSRVVYPVALIRGSKNTAAAGGYEDFLFSSAARQIFEKYGFTVLTRVE
jgi:molybdate transport system substrate-binding protein